MIEKYPRATSYHEAGHAGVAWSLGLQVGTIHVKKEDAGGGADIEFADHLSLVDQIAVCAAGYAAECTFGVENHDLASFTDQMKIADILEAHGVSEEEQGRRGGHAAARPSANRQWLPRDWPRAACAQFGAASVRARFRVERVGSSGSVFGRAMDRPEIRMSGHGWPRASSKFADCSPARSPGPILVFFRNYLKALDLQTALTAHIEGIKAFGALTNRPCERYFYPNDHDVAMAADPLFAAERNAILPLSIRSFA